MSSLSSLLDLALTLRKEERAVLALRLAESLNGEVATAWQKEVVDRVEAWRVKRARHPPFSLVQVIAFSFEESVGSWGLRFCPFLTPMEAHAAFEAWTLEATVWKGPPLLRSENSSGSRRVAWSDLRIKLAGTGIVLWIDGERDAETWWRNPFIFNDFPWEELRSWDEK